MSTLDTANFWMIVGVAIGFVLGVLVMGALFLIDRWVCTAFDQAERDGRLDHATDARSHTVWGGDSVTADDTYPGGTRP